MKVRLHFIPGSLASYFGLSVISLVELPDGAKYKDLVDFLKGRFEEASKSSNQFRGMAFPDSFMVLSDGGPISERLNEEINPQEEITIVMIADGG